MSGVAVASSAGLVGREVELGRLDRFVASLEDGAAAVLVGGGPGIGKTSLWRAALDRAEAGGLRVLRARCAEVEMPIAFGALADLLPLDASLEGVSPRHRAALTGALGGGLDQAPVDGLLLAGAALAALRAVAARGPVLVGIDDLQWLDSGSRRVLAYALRRAGDAPVGLLGTLREGSANDDPLALADALPAGRFDRLGLGALSWARSDISSQPGSACTSPVPRWRACTARREAIRCSASSSRVR